MKDITAVVIETSRKRKTSCRVNNFISGHRRRVEMADNFTTQPDRIPDVSLLIRLSTIEIINRIACNSHLKTKITTSMTTKVRQQLRVLNIQIASNKNTCTIAPVH